MMKPSIVIQTDFGNGGGGAMTGVIKTIDPSLDVFQANHNIEKFNVREAARNLNHHVPYWPSGTVFVSVVDPGVGTARRASVAKLKNGSYVVTPDNGALTLLLENPGVEAIRIIDETKNRLKGTEKVSIFHGRDLFAYCAGKLAAGIIDFEGVGEAYPVSEIVTYDALGYEVEKGMVKGYLTDMMRTFGNLETSIPVSAGKEAGFELGEKVHVIIKNQDEVKVDLTIPFEASFGWVKEGEEVVYNSSDGVIGVGINLGNFIEKYGLDFGKDWTITITKEETK
ncbi:MAG: SAM-dependent chlorinase/fluorinase [Solobacterium sp.]|nr:SAM-dependent chlorinase/fluorinase [Solobacterium sp.]